MTTNLPRVCKLIMKSTATVRSEDQRISIFLNKYLSNSLKIIIKGSLKLKTFIAL